MPIKHFAPIRRGKPPQFELKIKYSNTFLEEDSSDESDSDTETDSESDSSYYDSSSSSQGTVCSFYDMIIVKVLATVSYNNAAFRIFYVCINEQKYFLLVIVTFV